MLGRKILQNSGQTAKCPSVPTGPQHFLPVLRLPGFRTRVTIKQARISVKDFFVHIPKAGIHPIHIFFIPRHLIQHREQRRCGKQPIHKTMSRVFQIPFPRGGHRILNLWVFEEREGWLHHHLILVRLIAPIPNLAANKWIGPAFIRTAPLFLNLPGNVLSPFHAIIEIRTIQRAFIHGHQPCIIRTSNPVLIRESERLTIHMRADAIRQCFDCMILIRNIGSLDVWPGGLFLGAMTCESNKEKY